MKWVYIGLIVIINTIIAYDQPNSLNYGYTNILEGGPIHPSSGWYIHQYFAFYNAPYFLGNNGALLGNKKSPVFNIMWGITQFLYQTKKKHLLNAKIGLYLSIFYDLYSKIEKNNLGLTSNTIGFGDPYACIYLQWDPIMIHNRPFFVHRFELASSFPAGKYSSRFFVNPGNGFYYINPNWSATLYLLSNWAASCNLNYVWSAKNKHTGIQAGQAILINYSMEAELFKNWWFAVNGYFLQQYTDSKINGFKVPNRRERVFSIGPGVLYSLNDKVNFFGYVYFESKSRNHNKGINAIISGIINF